MLHKFKEQLWIWTRRIQWVKVVFLLIVMFFLPISENITSDMIVGVMVVALFLIATKSESKKSKKENDVVFVIVVIEKYYTKSSEDVYPEDYNNNESFSEDVYPDDYKNNESFSEDVYPDDYKNNENFMENVRNPFPDLDIKLGHIVDQVDERTFHARFCETNSIVTCYISDYTRPPLVGGLVRLLCSSGFAGFGPMIKINYIIEVIDSELGKGSPWVWNILLGKIIWEQEFYGETIYYASLDPEKKASLDSEKKKRCSMQGMPSLTGYNYPAWRYRLAGGRRDK